MDALECDMTPGLLMVRHQLVNIIRTSYLFALQSSQLQY